MIRLDAKGFFPAVAGVAGSVVMFVLGRWLQKYDEAHEVEQ